MVLNTKKRDVKSFLSENVTTPFTPELEHSGLSPEAEMRRLPFNYGDPIRLIRHAENIMIVTSGGDWPGSGAIVTGRGSTTAKIELPANWNKLVAKYKNIVPTYALY